MGSLQVRGFTVGPISLQSLPIYLGLPALRDLAAASGLEALRRAALQLGGRACRRRRSRRDAPERLCHPKSATAPFATSISRYFLLSLQLTRPFFYKSAECGSLPASCGSAKASTELSLPLDICVKWHGYERIERGRKLGSI